MVRKAVDDRYLINKWVSSRSSRDEELEFSLTGGYNRGGIFVQVFHSLLTNLNVISLLTKCDDIEDSCQISFYVQLHNIQSGDPSTDEYSEY